MNNFTYAAAICLLCSSGYAISACDEADVVARNFYRDDYSFAFKSPDALKTAVTPKLRELLYLESKCKSDGQSCAIDWDPWTSAQDGEVVGTPKTTVVSSSRTQARVRISLKLEVGSGVSLPRSATLVLSRTSIGDCWAVSDLDMGNRGSLLALLEAQHLHRPTGTSKK